MEEEQTFFYPHSSSGWSDNQIDMRKISKRKQPNLIHTYVWKPHMHTVPGYPTYMRESETPHTGEVQRQKGGLRYVRAGDEERCLGGFKGSLQSDKNR